MKCHSKRSWLTRSTHFLFNIVSMLQEWNSQEKPACHLFVLTTFSCTKAKAVGLALLGTKSWRRYLSRVGPSSFKPGSSPYLQLNHYLVQKNPDRQNKLCVWAVTLKACSSAMRLNWQSDLDEGNNCQSLITRTFTLSLKGSPFKFDQY